MAKGKLASANLTTTANTLLFTVDETPQTFNIRFANRNATNAHLRVAISMSAVDPADDEWVDYDVPCLAQGIMEDTGLVASSGEHVWVRTDLAGVSVRAHGM